MIMIMIIIYSCLLYAWTCKRIRFCYQKIMMILFSSFPTDRPPAPIENGIFDIIRNNLFFLLLKLFQRISLPQGIEQYTNTNQMNFRKLLLKTKQRKKNHQNE